MMHSKDNLNFSGFVNPKVTNRGDGVQCDISVSQRKTTGGVNYSVNFLKSLCVRLDESIERVSFRFINNRVELVINVPINIGVPFYKPTQRKKIATLNNKDLVNQIMTYINLNLVEKAYFNINPINSVKGVTVYELIRIENR